MCQWHTSREPTEPVGETMAPCGSRAEPWWGVGRSPMTLALGRRSKRKGRGRAAVGPPEPVRGTRVRFANSFAPPQERPQAAAHSKIPKDRKAWLSYLSERGGRQHPRWEAKRSGYLPFSGVSGILREGPGPPRLVRPVRSSPWLGKAALSQVNGFALLGFFGGACLCHCRTWAGRLKLCPRGFLVSAAPKGKTLGLCPKPRQGGTPLDPRIRL